MVDENSFSMISLPSVNSLEHMAISFFSFVLGPSCVQLFFHFFTWTFMCPYFFFSFFNSPCLFCCKKIGERLTHIVELLFVERNDGTMLTSHRSIARGVYGVHVNLDHKSMKIILPRVTTI